MTFPLRVLQTIRRAGMLAPGDHVVVAVSGGPDSVALLQVLTELRETLAVSLSIAHLDHGLRGSEGDDDRRFVEELARSLGLPMRSAWDDIVRLARDERCSIEDAGRRARRRFLRAVASEVGARRIALGHTLDDQAETVLLRLVAGAGRRGLSGMRPISEGLFVRPLLGLPRSDILAYLAARGAAYRSDSTNADERFARSRMRHEILPRLREGFNPRADTAIARAAEILGEEDAYLDARARRALARLRLTDAPEDTGARSHPASGGTAEGRGARSLPAGEASGDEAVRDRGLVLDALPLARLPSPLGRRVIRLALRGAGLRGRDLSMARIEDILGLASRTSPASLDLGAGMTARLEYGRLLIACAAGKIVTRASAARRGTQSAHPAERSGAVEGMTGNSGAADPRARDETSDRDDADHAVQRAGGVPGSTTTGPVSGQDSASPRPLPVPGRIEIESVGLAIGAELLPVEAVRGEYPSAPPHKAFLDARRVQAPLQVRPPLPGDRYRALGAPGSRKLSDLWIDRKIQRAARARSLVVLSGGGIVWVSGLPPAHGARITEATREVLVLDVAPLPATVRPAEERPDREPTWGRGPGVSEPRIASGAAVRYRPITPGAPDTALRVTVPRSEGPLHLSPGAHSSTPATSQEVLRPTGGALRASGPLQRAAPAAASHSAAEAGSHIAPAAVSQGASTPIGATAAVSQGASTPDGETAAGSPLFTASEIALAVRRLATEVAGWAAGQEIVVLGILQGSFIFLADLVRLLPGPVRIGFLDRDGVAVPRPARIEGARVVVVEDILDTGASLSRILARVRAERPAEVRTCVLFDKPSGRAAPIEADWTGLRVPDRWVVGYGLDQDGRLRHLPYLTWIPLASGGPPESGS